MSLDHEKESQGATIAGVVWVGTIGLCLVIPIIGIPLLILFIAMSLYKLLNSEDGRQMFGELVSEKNVRKGQKLINSLFDKVADSVSNY